MLINNYDIVLFDLDGTITDSAPGITNSVKYVLDRYNIEVKERSELLRFIGPPLYDSFTRFYGFDHDRATESVRLYREYYKEKGIFESTLYEGIEECISTLKAAGKTIVLATSKPQQFSERILDYFGLTRYFDFIAGATMDETRSRKTDVIKYALEQIKSLIVLKEGAEALADENKFLQRIIMVGDRENDICGAADNGIASMGVLFGFGDYEELSSNGADYIVNYPAEITRVLLSDIKYINHYRIIDSTNNEAKRLVEMENPSEPVLLFADEQTAGRGRQGKSFYSPADTGLYMSVILPVNADISSQVTMTTRTAVAVAMALEKEFNIAPEIKWVNDIYYEGNKCCGILCEAVNDYEKMVLKYAVIGVGINISTTSWPEDICNKAGCIGDLSGRGRCSYLSLAVSVAAAIIGLIRNRSDDGFLEYYRQHSNVIGREIVFVENNIETSAFAVDINNEGSLIVEIKDESGNSHNRILNSGEISVKI